VTMCGSAPHNSWKRAHVGIFHTLLLRIHNYMILSVCQAKILSLSHHMRPMLMFGRIFTILDATIILFSVSLSNIAVCVPFVAFVRYFVLSLVIKVSYLVSSTTWAK